MGLRAEIPERIEARRRRAVDRTIGRMTRRTTCAQAIAALARNAAPMSVLLTALRASLKSLSRDFRNQSVKPLTPILNENPINPVGLIRSRVARV